MFHGLPWITQKCFEAWNTEVIPLATMPLADYYLSVVSYLLQLSPGCTQELPPFYRVHSDRSFRSQDSSAAINRYTTAHKWQKLKEARFTSQILCISLGQIRKRSKWVQLSQPHWKNLWTLFFLLKCKLASVKSYLAFGQYINEGISEIKVLFFKLHVF